MIAGFDEKMQMLKTQNSSLESEVKTLKQEIIEKNEKLQKLEENSQKIIQTPTPQANPNAVLLKKKNYAIFLFNFRKP